MVVLKEVRGGLRKYGKNKILYYQIRRTIELHVG